MIEHGRQNESGHLSGQEKSVAERSKDIFQLLVRSAHRIFEHTPEKNDKLTSEVFRDVQWVGPLDSFFRAIADVFTI